MNTFDQPLVSVVCLTYNHEAYIRECLEGFVMQKTNFPIEIIVHDDASSDSTVSIVKEYEEKYPYLFNNVYRTENWYSQGKDIWGYLFTQKIKGKYIALCEGDDYWIDPLKLQKQVDFLEGNPEYSMCCTDFFCYVQQTGERFCKPLTKNTVITLDDQLYKGNLVSTLTVLYRNSLVGERFEMVHYAEPGRKPKWGYFPSEGHPEVVTKFEGTKATPEFLQAIAYEVYVKNVTFGLLHQWLIDMGMTLSPNTLRNWLKKGKKYLDELVRVLKSIALEKDSIVNCDETWCKVRKYDHYKKCYIWVLVNKAEQVAIFFYEDGSRGRDVLTDFLGDAELKSIMSDGYNAYVFIGNELKSAQFKDTVHQVCLPHLNNKFVKAFNQGKEENAALFSADLKEFFRNERKYDEAGLTPEERLQERQSLATKEIVIRIRSRLENELAKDSEFRSQYYTETLNYLNHFWDEFFAFLQDGEFPIDNNLAERTTQKLTTQRNNSLHYGSDAGVEMAATYHSVISTVKLHGSSVWNFIGTFFGKSLTGAGTMLIWYLTRSLWLPAHVKFRTYYLI